MTWWWLRIRVKEIDFFFFFFPGEDNGRKVIGKKFEQFKNLMGKFVNEIIKKQLITHQYPMFLRIPLSHLPFFFLHMFDVSNRLSQLSMKKIYTLSKLKRLALSLSLKKFQSFQPMKFHNHFPTHIVVHVKFQNCSRCRSPPVNIQWKA